MCGIRVCQDFQYEYANETSEEGNSSGFEGLCVYFPSNFAWLIGNVCQDFRIFQYIIIEGAVRGRIAGTSLPAISDCDKFVKSISNYSVSEEV
jgi:hypothetical protein